MKSTENTNRNYRPRVLDSVLQTALQTAGAVVIEGARATGKTMTALNACASHVFLDDDEAIQWLETSPETVLQGASPRLLDEWQVAPQLWNMVRRRVDAANQTGLFILTGSATPSDDATRHTGAGRFLRIRQHTMSWWEKSDRATGTVSLRQLFDQEPVPLDPSNPWQLDEVITHLLRPGFPALIDRDEAASARLMRAYIDEVTHTDIQQIAEVRHSPQTLKQLVVSLARLVAADVNYRTLASDLRSTAPTIDPDTTSRYVQLLQRLFVVEEQLAWTPRLRLRARLRTSPKLHLVDPALAAAALGAGRQHLQQDLSTVGSLFESAVFHDLQVYSSALEGQVFFYRDSNGKEIDAIVTLPDGRWGAVEVKLGARQTTQGINSLKEAVAQIDTDTVGQPSFLLVITGTGSTITTGDGVVVTPLGSLCP